MLTLSKICLFLLLLPLKAASSSSAGVARWSAETARWGTLSASASSTNSTNHPSPNKWENLAAGVVPLAASTQNSGRIFFYFMHQITLPGAALTISQASIKPQLFALGACGAVSSAVDAQDPRCAKITFSGTVLPCPDQECESIGKQALFATHPSMETWPEDHDFHVHEMKLDSIWMIANFGGASHITPEDYASTKPKVHKVPEGEKVSPPTPLVDGNVGVAVVPHWNDTVARARWIVHQSRWGTVSTIKSAQEASNKGKFFGNIRSTTDGAYCESSTGRPVFQLPNVDPTAQDIMAHNVMALSFTEASIAARVNRDTGVPCDGQDAGSPLCGQVILYGHAAAIDPSSIKLSHILNWFKRTHPLAPWLAQKGGSHMPGKFYTIEIVKIVILDYFGGYHEVNVGDYLQYNLAEHAGEYCQAYPSTMGDNSSEHGEGQDKLFFVIISGTCLLFAAAWIGLGVARKTRSQYQAVIEATAVV